MGRLRSRSPGNTKRPCPVRGWILRSSSTACVGRGTMWASPCSFSSLVRFILALGIVHSAAPRSSSDRSICRRLPGRWYSSGASFQLFNLAHLHGVTAFGLVRLGCIAGLACRRQGHGWICPQGHAPLFAGIRQALAGFVRGTRGVSALGIGHSMGTPTGESGINRGTTAHSLSTYPGRSPVCSPVLPWLSAHFLGRLRTRNACKCLIFHRKRPPSGYP